MKNAMRIVATWALAGCMIWWMWYWIWPYGYPTARTVYTGSGAPG